MGSDQRHIIGIGKLIPGKAMACAGACQVGMAQEMGSGSFCQHLGRCAGKLSMF